LGDVPINLQIRVHGDQGRTNASFDDAGMAPVLEKICYTLAKNLANQHRAVPPLPTLSVLR
jgi:ATP-binding protein involved in chromosome partitioning